MSSEDRLLMYRSGTLRYQPTARAILQAADQALLELRESARVKNDRNQARAQGASAKFQGRARKGAFLYQHVRSAACAADVLRAAIKGIRDADKSKEVHTLYIYQSAAHLQEALDLAIARDAASAGDAVSGSGQADWVGAQKS